MPRCCSSATGRMRDTLVRLARELGVARDVVFVGAKPWAELPPYFAAGDVFCMPTRTRKAGFEVEGLGIVYLEASATGLPVVAGDSGGAPDAVVDGETGYVVDGRSPDAISHAVSHVLTDHGLAAQLAKNGRGWAVQHWTWNAVEDRLHEVLAADDALS